jgi:penicillin-binding protein 1C
VNTWLSVLFLGLLGPSVAQAVPSFEEVKASYRSSDAVLVDRHGEVLDQRRVSSAGRRLAWTSLDEISPRVIPTLLLAEDRRFFEHHGVDWQATAASAASWISGRASRGASTITMQVAALLDPARLRPAHERRSLTQKWHQMQVARSIESTWTKREILEAYLNLVTFRGEWQGLHAASRGLFGKAPHGLTQGDAVILIALLRAPRASADAVTTRACRLAADLELAPPCAAIEDSVRIALSRREPLAIVVSLAPHLGTRLLTGRAATSESGHTVASTLDVALQRLASESLRTQLDGLSSRHVTDGAVLAVDNQTGQVLAYVGSSGARSPAPFVDGVRAPRQAGSTLKPFLYGLAFERTLLTTASRLDDSPLDVPLATGIYRPKNYDSRFRGLVTAREALASSLNVPAVRTLALVGADPFIERLKAWGFEHIREDGDFYGPSLALGSAEVTLWELVRAYRALAMGGRWQDLQVTLSGPPGVTRSVGSPESAYLVSDILADREARSHTFGLESVLATRFWSAVKTGTSTDMRDNWCIGYSDRYTVGVWVGNFSGEPMWNVSGMSGAAPVWLEIMNRLHENRPGQPITPPPSLVKASASSIAAERGQRDWFLPGTEPRRTTRGPAAAQPRIQYPAPDTVTVIDPDIPAGRQRLFFESAGWQAGLRWTVDEVPLESAESLVSWIPRPGRHRVALRTADGLAIDGVSFLVKGGSAATGKRKERSRGR